MAAAKKKITIPKTTGACADRLFKIKEEAAKIREAGEALDEERKAIEAHLIATLPKSDTTGVTGKMARVRIVTKDIPQARDWDKLYAYIKRNNRFDFLQRRLSAAAVNEVLDSGKKVPGVGIFTATTVSLTKA